jgi:2-haloacid dehalogenase
LGSNLPGAARLDHSVQQGAALATFVFDAYGTLFDVNAAIARHRDAAGPHADRLSEMWRTKQLEYTWTLSLAGRYVDFWTLTERALDYALARVPSVAPTLKSPLLEAYLRLDAFADARTTLAELKRRGHRTAILSNGSPRMLDAAVAAAGIGAALDTVLSVESVGVYKPDPRVYTLVTATFKVAPGAVTFVSSNRWDVMGATTFGFRALWINRQGAPDEYAEAAPVRVLADLTRLLAIADAAPP